MQERTSNVPEVDLTAIMTALRRYGWERVDYLYNSDYSECEISGFLWTTREKKKKRLYGITINVVDEGDTLTLSLITTDRKGDTVRTGKKCTSWGTFLKMIKVPSACFKDVLLNVPGVDNKGRNYRNVTKNSKAWKEGYRISC